MKIRANDTVRVYENYRDYRRQWDEAAQEDIDFVLNKQWEQWEEKELLLRGQAPLVINRLYPAVMQEIAIMNARPVEFRVTARDDGDVRVAKIGNDILQFILYNSNWPMLYNDVLFDFLVAGVGYFYVYLDKYNEYGTEVMIDRLDPFWVYMDPYSAKRDGSDAEHIIVSRQLTEHQLRMYIPDLDITDVIRANQEMFTSRVRGTKANDGSVIQPGDICDPSRGVYRIIEDYTVGKEKAVRLYDTTTGRSQLYKPDEFEKIAREPVVREALRAGVYKPRDVWAQRSYRTVSIGNVEIIQKEELPSRDRPVIPVVNVYTGTPYPVGEVRFFKGVQKEINKRRSLMIAHASTSTAAKLLAEEGAFSDITETERKLARPGSIITYNQGSNPPTQVQPQPLPSALYTLEQEAKYDLEYGLGLFAISHGSPEGAPHTFSATLALEEYGNRRLNMKQKLINQSLTRVGRVVWDYMQHAYDDERVLRIVNPAGEEKEVKINIVDRVTDDDVRRVLDVTTGTYDIIAVAGSTMASNRWAELEQYKELLQMGVIDLQEFYKKLDIFDREGLLERMDDRIKMQQQIEQLGSAVESMKKQLNNRENQIDGLLMEIARLQNQIKLQSQKGKEENK